MGDEEVVKQWIPLSNSGNLVMCTKKLSDSDYRYLDMNDAGYFMASVYSPFGLVCVFLSGWCILQIFV